MDQMFKDVPCAFVYLDDILVAVATKPSIVSTCGRCYNVSATTG